MSRDAWEAHAGWVRRLVRGMVRDEHLAEEIAQDALAAGLEAPAGSVREPRAWLRGVVRQLHAQEVRRGKARTTREQRAARPEGGAPSAAELASRAEVQRMVAKEVLALPEPYRETPLLRYFEDMPVRRIAAARGLDRRAVESRLRRGKELLRERLRTRLGDTWAATVLPLAALPFGALPLGAGATTALLMNAKNAALLLAGLLGLALLVVLDPLGLAGTTDSEVRPGRGELAAGARAEAVAGEGATASAPTDVEREVIAGASAERGGLVGAPARDTLLVRVIRDEDAEPVPGATLWYVRMDAEASKEMTRLRQEGADLRQQYEAVGIRLTADERGLARVPKPDGPSLQVAAVADGAFIDAYAAGDRMPEELVLRMRPEYHVRARVVGPSGAPCAGATVMVTRHRPPQSGVEFARDLAGGRTDADGEVELRHLQTEFDALTDSRDEARLAIRTPGSNEPFVVLDPRVPPDGTVELRMPPTGAVEFELVDAAGEPVSGRAYVMLQRAPTAEERAAFPGQVFNPEATRGYRQADVVEGRAVFPYVPLDRTLDYGAMFPDRPKYVTGTVTGPRRAGETIRVRLTTPPAAPALIGTFVTPEGVLGGAQRRIPGVAIKESTMGSLHVEVDADGRFRLDTQGGNLGDGAGDDLVFWHVASAQPGILNLGFRHLSESLVPGDNDLGEIRLGFEAVVAGRVVDPAGAPIPGVGMRVYGRSRLKESYELWSGRDNPVFRTGDDGVFEIRGDRAFEPTRIEFSRDGYRPSQLTVGVGQLAHEVVLQPTVALACELDLPPALANRVKLIVRWDQESGPSGLPPLDYLRLPVEDGPDLLTGLPSAGLEVQVRCSTSGELLALVEGLDLRHAAPDTPHVDPRLTPLRVDGLQERLLEIRSAATGEALDAVVTFPDISLARHEAHAGILSVVSFGEGPRAEVWAPDHRKSQAFLGSARTLLEMSRGIPVRLRLLGDGAGSSDATLTAHVGVARQSAVGEVRDGEALVHVPLAGEGYYWISAAFPDLVGSTRVPLDGNSNTTRALAIEDTPIEQLVEIEVTAEQVAAARAALEKQQPKD